MSKLHFKYGAMNAGKSMHIIMTYYNYINLKLNPVAVIPNQCDEEIIRSRTGAEIKAIKFKEFQKIEDINKYDVILVDESQFLSKDEILELFEISVKTPVICYGLRTNSEGEPFEGSKYLLALSDNLEEIPTICHCGKRARMNLRLINDKIDNGKQEVILKDNDNVKYISVCKECYLNYKKYNKNIEEIIEYYNN